MKKKVLFLIHDLMGGGAEKVLVNLVNNMDKSKFDITVMSLFDVGVNKQYLSNQIRYQYCYKKLFRGNMHYMKLFSPEQLHRKYIKEEYDIEVAYLEGPCARIISGCPNKRTKLVSWIHSKMDTQTKAALGFRNYQEAQKCYGRFDRIVAVSKWVRDFFSEALQYKGTVEVLYNTIETEKISRLADEPIDDVTFSKECINICSTGKITANKAFDRIARIHKRLLDEGINNRVYIMGVGNEQAKIEDYLHRYKLANSFFFLGFKDNPYKYVKQCDLYVCSSYSEGFSTAVTEALIVGTPVVTTLCSGMTELLGENNEYGIITENDEDALYEGIKKIISTPAILKDYSKRAIERGKRFSTRLTVESVESMLL